MKNRQYLLMIMDGVGLNDEEKGNAFKLANPDIPVGVIDPTVPPVSITSWYPCFIIL